MIEEKETQLKRYFEISKAILNALHQGDDEKVPILIEQREVCISTINKLDAEAGKILMNEIIQVQLTELSALEKEIQNQLQQTMEKLSTRVRYAQNEHYLRSQYDDRVTVSKGVFYDSKK
jgi:CRISPR/Cas system CMR subunit Cmr4 (Cas7 group RAMP superfamily)